MKIIDIDVKNALELRNDTCYTSHVKNSDMNSDY